MAKYVKRTLETKFHIDFEWWQKEGRFLKTYLQSHACPEAKQLYAEEYNNNTTYDWIHPETGQVFSIDILWHLIHTHCSQEPDFITEQVPLTTAIFRLFIANNNIPLTPLEIQERLPKKSAETILKTIGGHKIYNGIRPVTPLI